MCLDDLKCKAYQIFMDTISGELVRVCYLYDGVEIDSDQERHGAVKECISDTCKYLLFMKIKVDLECVLKKILLANLEDIDCL